MRKIFFLWIIFLGFLWAQQPVSVLQLKWGTGDQQVGFRQAPDANYGPRAFQVKGDTILVLDTENGWLKAFRDGQLLEKFPVPPFSDDFYFSSPNQYLVLSQNTVYLYREGNLRESFQPSSPRELIESLQPLEANRIALNLIDGRNLLLDLNARQLSKPAQGMRISGEQEIQLRRRSASEALIELNDHQIRQTFPQNNLASLRFLGRDRAGNLFVNFEFFVQQVPLSIRREIAVLSPSGQRLATLRIPVNNYTYIFRDYYLVDDGTLYHLRSSTKGIEIFLWNLSEHFNPQNPPVLEYPAPFWEAKHYNWLNDGFNLLGKTGETAASEFADYPQVLPEDVLRTADEYVQLNWYCTDDNLTNGIVTDEYGYLVQTPYWVQTGSNRQVPYKWGGFETVEQFLNGIDIGKYAGDVYTSKSGGTPSAVGVDCSGFVSRCWDLPKHYSTRMMDDALALPYSSWEEAEPGDAVHKPGHVRLVVRQNGNGSLLVVESSGADWRVSYRNYYYADLTAYTPRYYVNRQGAPGNLPQPRFDYVETGQNAVLHWSMAGQENTDVIRLYASADGETWELLATLPDTVNQYEIPLANGESKYFRLGSVSGETESEPSDAYGVYRNDAHTPPVLIVDGFDRTSATNGIWTHIQHPFAITLGQALAAQGIPFETADNDAILRGEVNLDNYPAVFWLLGDESTHDATFDYREQELVKAYLQQGGKLFVSGSEVAWDLSYKGSDYDKDFFNNFLKAKFGADDSYNYTAEGVVGTPFAGLTLHFDDGNHGIYEVKYPDLIFSLNGSSTALVYGNGYGAAIYYEGIFPGGTTAGKLFYLAFPFETVYDEAERLALMEKIAGFFELSHTTEIADRETTQPQQFTLDGNYPNPFNGQTTIRFYLPASGHVELRVFNTLGQTVLQKDYRYTTAGEKKIALSSNQFSSGVYFYRLSYQVGKKVHRLTRSMVVAR